jgi:hypothetical protein
VQRDRIDVTDAPEGVTVRIAEAAFEAPVAGRAPSAVLERPTSTRSRVAMTRVAMTRVVQGTAPAVRAGAMTEVAPSLDTDMAAGQTAAVAAEDVASPPATRSAPTHTAAALQLAAAGWLTDPTGRHQHRWWDGALWTDCVADAGTTSRDPGDA